MNEESKLIELFKKYPGIAERISDTSAFYKNIYIEKYFYINKRYEKEQRNQELKHYRK